jgi:predicted GIY-YIG superfamily endonuclease
MGNAYRGIVHPCKVYNILALGTPLLYIGPAESHVADLAANDACGEWSYTARHGEAELVAAHVMKAKHEACRHVIREKQLASRFSRQILLTQLVNEIHNVAAPKDLESRALQAAG